MKTPLPGILLASLLALALASVPATQAATAAQGDRQAPRSAAARFIDDASITANIKARHAEDRSIRITAIGVETRNGVVQLSGFTPSPAEKTRAEALAWTIPGVKAVQNDIILIN